MPVTLLCNADFEMSLRGTAPSTAQARARNLGVARLFALCGPPGSRLLMGVGNHLEELDCAAIQQEASQLGLYDGQVAQEAPWLQDGHAALFPYAWDTRAAHLSRSLGVREPIPDATVKALNSKAWSHVLATRLGLEPGVFQEARLLRNPLDLLEHLHNSSDAAVHAWTIKPVFGFAGGGRIHGAGRAVDKEQQRKLGVLCRQDGVALWEPWVERSMDLSTQVWCSGSGKVSVLAQGRLMCSPTGRYAGNAGATWLEEAPDAVRVCRDAALAVGGALVGAGFQGVAGVDAFTFKDPQDGSCRVRPLVEVNARFTMGLMAAHVAGMARARGRLGGDGWRFRMDPALPFGRWEQDQGDAPAGLWGRSMDGMTHGIG